MAAPVFIGILDGRDKKDEGEGKDRSPTAEDRKLGELVEDGDDEEVDVGDTVELLEQVAGEEGENRVLAGADRIAREFKPLVGPRGVVDEDDAGIVVGDVPLRCGEALGLGARAVADVDWRFGEGDAIERGTGAGRALRGVEGGVVVA